MSKIEPQTSTILFAIFLCIAGAVWAHQLLIYGQIFDPNDLLAVASLPISISNIHHELLIVIFGILALLVAVFSDGFKDW